MLLREYKCIYNTVVQPGGKFYIKYHTINRQIAKKDWVLDFWLTIFMLIGLSVKPVVYNVRPATSRQVAREVQHEIDYYTHIKTDRLTSRPNFTTFPRLRSLYLNGITLH